jgi:hypothetical protein
MHPSVQPRVRTDGEGQGIYFQPPAPSRLGSTGALDWNRCRL